MPKFRGIILFLALLAAAIPAATAATMLQAPTGSYRPDWHQAPFATPMWLVQCLGQCPGGGFYLVSNPQLIPAGGARILGGPYRHGGELAGDRQRLLQSGLPAQALPVEVLDERWQRIDGLVLADAAELARMTATAQANIAGSAPQRPAAAQAPVSPQAPAATAQARLSADYPRGGAHGVVDLHRSRPMPLNTRMEWLDAAQRQLVERFEIQVLPYRILGGSGAEVVIANARGPDYNLVLRVGTSVRLCNRGQLYEFPISLSRAAANWANNADSQHLSVRGRIAPAELRHRLALGQCTDFTPDQPGLVNFGCDIHAHEHWRMLVLPADHDLSEESIHWLMLRVSQGQSGEYAMFSRRAAVAPAAQASGGGCSGFAGTWSTNRGFVILQRGAGGYGGRYDFSVPSGGPTQGNALSGLMVGRNSIDLTFEQAGHADPKWRTGLFRLELGADGRSFSGEIWASDGTAGGALTGTCQGPPL